ncbi:MAG TPA: circularly permuted type 2 ATP-grasp protein [Opitutaceae bacterium]
MPAARPSTSLPHPAQLRALRSRLRARIRDASLTDLSPADTHGHPKTGLGGETPFWELEPTPLVIDVAEWSLLEAGLRQRARLVNAFLVDLYAGQQVLKQGILPPEVILADPYYRRPCLGLEPQRQCPATLLRFDLVKTTAGWQVASTWANTPIGLSYAVQNRRFMTQEAVDLYRNLPDYQSIINFPLQLLDALHALSPLDDRAPSIVVLSAGPHDPFYSEHSFLARKMGLPLARGDDLLVLDNHVYFKTIAGLERVDVIYRRLNDTHIDPVVFSTDRETAGIPGLLQCIRTGNVVLANATGTGVAESRALDAYLPQLMRFYLGEKPLLPSVPTFTCGDTDQLDFILDRRDELHLRPIHAPRLGASRPTPSRDLLSMEGLAQVVRENPYGFVAQPHLETAPLVPGARKTPPFRLSAFVLSSRKHYAVLPGGLVWLGAGEPPMDRVGATADALVFAAADTASGEVADYEPTMASGVQANTLGSRSAEHLFWLGRYLERAEATARMLAILDDVALEEIPARERRRWLPVWRGLLEATGHGNERITARERPKATLGGDLAWRMTLEAENPSSIRSSIHWAADNARQLRDHVSPEAWTVLSRLATRLDQLHRTPARGELRAALPPQAVAAVLADVNAFLSTAERTMLHDAGWHFLRLGVHLERAIMTCSALRHVLGTHDEAASAKTGSAEAAPADAIDAQLVYRDNPELSALLRMLGSQDAYRRLYQTRSQPRFVAELFLQQSEAPRSLAYNLHHIRLSLQAIRAGATEEEDPTACAANDLLKLLRGVRLDRYFGAMRGDEAADRQALSEVLADLLNQLYGLHPLLSDHYFSHQARLTAVTAQGEFPL